MIVRFYLVTVFIFGFTSLVSTLGFAAADIAVSQEKHGSSRKINSLKIGVVDGVPSLLRG